MHEKRDLQAAENNFWICSYATLLPSHRVLHACSHRGPCTHTLSNDLGTIGKKGMLSLDLEYQISLLLIY